jgi:hypothetical protein
MPDSFDALRHRNLPNLTSLTYYQLNLKTEPPQNPPEEYAKASYSPTGL